MFSKVCMLVRFILMLEVYIKIVWVTNTIYISGSFERAAGSSDRAMTSRFSSPRRLIQWIRKHWLEAQLHSQYCTRQNRRKLSMQKASVAMEPLFLAHVQFQKQIQPSLLEAESFESLQSPPSMLSGQATPSLLFPFWAPAQAGPVCVRSYQKRQGSCVSITSPLVYIASLSALIFVLSKLVPIK